jgi:glycosyltransferase involved in cell wall biosynthesis
MKVAFYAPMKPTDHPVPSGDRAMGQSLLRALRTAGHETFVASRFRSFDVGGDATRQQRLQVLAHRLAARLVRRLRHPAARPDLWFTYHLHHKAPDWLGPAVCHALDIPYVVAEASVATKQSRGAWAVGYAGSVAAIEAAAATIFLNPVDLAGVRALRGPARADECVPPFLDLAGFAVAASASAAEVPVRSARARLITVAMMRPGAKLASYRLLAGALAQITFPPWELVIVGDGKARRDVEAAFACFDPDRIRLVGFQDAPTVAAWLRASDIFVWPAIDEAFGMALIEAQACGLPVVAGDGGGVAGVVAPGRTGLLVPVGDAGAFAAAILRLLTETELRRRMASEAAAYAKSEHDLPAAASRLDAVLRRVTTEYRQRAPIEPAPAAVR